MRKKEEVHINNALLNVIAPMGLEYARNGLTIGENQGKIYGCIKYSQEHNYGWLERPMNVPGTIASITFKPLIDGEILNIIDKNVSTSLSRANNAKSELEKQRAEREATNGAKTLKQIDEHDETVGLVGLSIMPMADTESNLVKIERHTKSVLSGAKCKVRIMANQQEEAFKQMSPTYTTEESVGNIIDRITPLRTIVGGFPFASAGLNDGAGSYFAKDNNGGLIILELWKRYQDRTNSNFLVTGLPGVGKTTILKLIAIIQYMLGTRIIFIDPEREMKDLTKNLGGDWINAGGGKKGKINPLQITDVPKDVKDDELDENTEDDAMGSMAKYMKHLEVFFKLRFPTLTDVQESLLKDTIIELYNNKNISWDTDITNLKNTDFPILEELWELLISRYEKSKDDPDYYKLATLLKDMAKGSDAFIWNGYTSIDTSAKCVCLDTHDLQDAPDNIKSTQYYNIMTWAWQEMSKDREEKVMLICGESYLMVDPNVPQSLVFLRNIEKRCRKYEAALVLDTHDIVDFLDPRVKMYGQSLLSLPTYKIFMGTDGQNLEEMTKLYNLTQAERDMLEAKIRGEGLFMAGSKRMKAKFDIPDYKLDMMGKAGGR